MENKKYCILAGGCFWCIAQPFYCCEGIIKVYSGYSGGVEKNPKYEDVKAQLTSHREAIKIVYNNDIISYDKILNIYFDNIDLFDSEGQFIDKGYSYTCALYYQNKEMFDMIKKRIIDLERKYNKKVCVEICEEKEFYMAEDYHQEFALKNSELMEKELRISGRK